MREGRPRGAPGRGRAVHGGRPGDDRPRRLAAERVPHARAAAVLRRHLLPARAAPRACRAWTQVLQAVADDVGARTARRSAPAASACASGCPGARARLRAVARRADRARRSTHGGRERSAARRSTRATAASAARRSSRQRVGDRVPARWRDGRARDGDWRTLRAMARGGIYDQLGGGFAATASTPPGRCRISRRCSTTTRCSHAPTCTAGRASARRCLSRSCRDTLDWALREMRGPEGGFYCRAGRRLGGRRGTILRVDARRSCSEASARTPTPAIAWFGATEEGNFDGRTTPSSGRTCWARARTGPRASIRTRLLEVREQPHRARPRRQAADELERADDRRARRRRRGARRAPLPRRGASPCAEFVLRDDARRQRPAAAHLQRRPGQIGAYLEDHAFCWRR